MKVQERALSIHEIINSAKEERLLEVFGASTPSFIQPISKIVYRDQTVNLANSTFEHSKYLNNLLRNIMTGPVDHPWVFKMDMDY